MHLLLLFATWMIGAAQMEEAVDVEGLKRNEQAMFFDGKSTIGVLQFVC